MIDKQNRFAIITRNMHDAYRSTVQIFCGALGVILAAHAAGIVQSAERSTEGLDGLH